MKCSESQRAMLLDTTGELPERARSRLKRHMAGCPCCRRYAEEVGRVTEVAELLVRPREPRPCVMAAIRDAAEARVSAKGAGVGVFPFPRTLAYAAAAMLVVGLWLGLSGNPRWQRISEVSTMVAMVSETQEVSVLERSDVSGREEALRSLAKQLLHMQGFAVEDLNEAEAWEPDPTAHRWHSNPALWVRVCV